MDRTQRLSRRAPLEPFMMLTLAVLCTEVAQAASWRITFRGQNGGSQELPVFSKIDADVPPGDYLLTPEKGSKSLPAHVFEFENAKYLGTVLRTSEGDASSTFLMTPDTKSEDSRPGVEFRPVGVNLEVLVGGKPLTVYHTDEPSKPYFYPLVGPTGAMITRSYPMENVAGEDRDHPHQRSFWFTFGNLNGYDFWASDPINKPNPKFGKIKETSRKATAGSGVGIIKTTDDWLGPDGKIVCQDERTVTFYDTKSSRILDFDVTMNATAGPFTFNDTKEGMFGLRVASSMDAKKKTGGKITNAEGVTDGEAWGKASSWVDYTGPVEGKTVGIAILNHPASFRYPTTWHVRDYGLFAANPFGWHDFGQNKSGTHVVAAGESVRFRYRVILHEGDTTASKIADPFRAYSNPVSVEIKAE